MNTERWKTNKTSVYNLGFHIIWCPKFRRKVLKDGIDVRLKELLREKAEERGWVIEEMEVMEDHVHIFIKVNPVDSVAFVVAQLKGYTSHELKKEFPNLWRRLPSLWSRSYYAESYGCMSEDKIKEYIDKQKFSYSNKKNKL